MTGQEAVLAAHGGNVTPCTLPSCRKTDVSAYKCFIHQMSCSEYPVSSFMYPSSLCSAEHFPHESDLGLKTSTVCSYKVSKYHSEDKDIKRSIEVLLILLRFTIINKIVG